MNPDIRGVFLSGSVLVHFLLSFFCNFYMKWCFFSSQEAEITPL